MIINGTEYQLKRVTGGAKPMWVAFSIDGIRIKASYNKAVLIKYLKDL